MLLDCTNQFILQGTVFILIVLILCTIGLYPLAAHVRWESVRNCQTQGPGQSPGQVISIFTFLQNFYGPGGKIKKSVSIIQTPLTNHYCSL